MCAQDTKWFKMSCNHPTQRNIQIWLLRFVGMKPWITELCGKYWKQRLVVNVSKSVREAECIDV